MKDSIASFFPEGAEKKREEDKRFTERRPCEDGKGRKGKRSGCPFGTSSTGSKPKKRGWDGIRSPLINY